MRDRLAFLKEGIWRTRVSDLPANRGMGLRVLRVLVLSVRGFAGDKCLFLATALTYYTFLSVVPILALVLGIAKGFGLEGLLRRQFVELLAGQQEVAGKLLSFAMGTLEQARGSVIAGAGLLVLFWSVFRVFGNMESIFNRIWGFQRSRRLGRQIVDYLSAAILGPLLWVLASASTVMIAGRVLTATEKVQAVSAISPFVYALLSLGPFAVLWMLLSFMYIFVPNGHVRWRSAILAGIVAGTLFQVFQWGYIRFQFEVTRHNALYGGFAFIPLMLLWIQASWIIVLFGAEFAFAHQNAPSFELEPDVARASWTAQKALMVRLAQEVVAGFMAGKKPRSAEDLARDADLPLRPVQVYLGRLVQAGILAETMENKQGVCGFIPAVPIERLSIADVTASLEGLGGPEPAAGAGPEMEAIRSRLASLAQNQKNDPENKLLKDIACAANPYEV